ncbi:SGNH/GDSL hydrolase family protein [Singulisphaera acidiphila]|uniref:Lysophospholipase L1-like esterase n=1 Tax=Singulisphaera acidiphila (strain ATCC BAA-1392 / DSM 18658 / VKM B-2454 / MOB10) TaxID=886293 RepID=L0DMP3_SINAD|nr:SGNH/GDSL hydrolase family protein [Singulisphaera acidiphila]AGA30113.1 lysophospholipase L1-like esterase [Singulisphaera acidiphila DSM 18658]
MRAARIAAYLVLALAPPALAEEPFYLKDGDRVVFYGDSITDQRLYTTFVETYVVTRFPSMNVSFVHSGWGGDRVTGGGGGSIDTRLKRDVLAYRPTVMTIMLGMNDASYRPFDENIFQTYAKGMERIVEKVKAELPEIRITLIRPSPFDDVTRRPVFPNGYNAVLIRYGDFLKELAEKEHTQLADLNTSVVNATKKAYETDPEKATKLNPDRVHPGPGGQLLMAAALLDAWDAPALVSSVDLKIESSSEPKVQVEKTKVSDVQWKDNVLKWTQLDESLPFPVDLKDDVIKLAVNSSDFAKDLDQQKLKVAGLEGADYVLSIDGEDVGSFSKDQLAEGINLALLSTPMTRQASEVHSLTLKHNNIHFTRWRQIQVPLSDIKSPHLDEAIADLDRVEAEIVDQQRAAAQPKPRRYELKPKA